MQVKQLSNGVTVCAVMVPEGASQFGVNRLFRTVFSYLHWIDGKPKIGMEDLPPGAWQQPSITVASGLTEEEWNRFIPFINGENDEEGYEHFMTDEQFANSNWVEAKATAKLSGLSLLASMGCNPNTTVLLIQVKK